MYSAMDSNPPISASVLARNAMVLPSANSATPNKRATSTRGGGVSLGPVQAGHQTDPFVFQWSSDRFQVTRLHFDVAVVHQQNFVAGVPRQLRKYCNFLVRCPQCGDMQRNGQGGKFAPQLFDI